MCQVHEDSDLQLPTILLYRISNCQSISDRAFPDGVAKMWNALPDNFVSAN